MESRSIVEILRQTSVVMALPRRSSSAFCADAQAVTAALKEITFAWHRMGAKKPVLGSEVAGKEAITTRVEATSNKGIATSSSFVPKFINLMLICLAHGTASMKHEDGVPTPHMKSCLCQPLTPILLVTLSSAKHPHICICFQSCHLPLALTLKKQVPSQNVRKETHRFGGSSRIEPEKVLESL